MNTAFDNAAAAVELMVSGQIDQAMSRYNG